MNKSAYMVALIAIGSCGFVYRGVAHHLYGSGELQTALSVPFSDFPNSIGEWTGKEIALDENLSRAAGNDDFCSRMYTNSSTNEYVNLYIAFSARPRTMVGHSPDKCYTGAGWILASTEKSSFALPSGRQIPCLMHRFYVVTPQRQELVVLSFYIVNGKISNDERSFSGIGWRTPHIDGQPARYVAQVQISSFLEGTVLTAAQDIAERLLDLFPDVSGGFE